MPQTTASKYSRTARALHWLMAVTIIGLLIVGLIMADMSRDDPNRAVLFALHKSFGLTILALAFLRLALKLFSPGPPLPDAIPAMDKHLSGLGHATLYFFMFAMPVTGYLMSASSGAPVRWFGFAVPRLVSIDRDRGRLANELHGYGAYILMGVVALHVLAVLFHYRRHGVNLLKRMI